ncbi:hypothetical protein KZ287_32055, partial [Escherichia coli]|nr:hypothetical protein [Escherichia coli]
MEDAVQGAQDIIAEIISDEPSYRQWIRDYTFKHGVIETEARAHEKDEKNVYEMYYEYKESVSKIVPHRVLAMN